MTAHCTQRPDCHARHGSGHWCPATIDQVRKLGYMHEPCQPMARKAGAKP